MAFLRSKLTQIIFAAIVLGCIGGLLAARSAMPQGAVSAAGVGQASASASSGVTATGGGSASTTATTGSSSSPTAGGGNGGTGGGGGGGGGSPTSTVPGSGGAVPSPTATRVPPTPTPIPQAGQPLTVRGDVTSVNQSSDSFVVHVSNNGGTYTCNASGSTQWSGAATSISTLQVGMYVHASGIYQGNNTLTMITSVNADNNN